MKPMPFVMAALLFTNSQPLRKTVKVPAPG